MVEWGRESKTVGMYTHGEIGIFSEPLPRSTLAKLVQGHLKAPNHPCFFSLLYFRAFRQGYLKAPNHPCFFSLLYFRAFRQGYLKAPNLDWLRFSAFVCLVQFRLFSISHPSAVWRTASIQSDITSHRSSAGLLLSQHVSAGVKILPGLYTFSDAHAKNSSYAWYVGMVPV